MSDSLNKGDVVTHSNYPDNVLFTLLGQNGDNWRAKCTRGRTYSSLWPHCLKKINSNTKETNPKDEVGTKKVPFGTVSMPVIAEVGVAMHEGSRKYGRHNYRVSKVKASVYFDATMRHIASWYEGEDIDPDSGMSHVTKAIASLVILRDAMIQDQLVDDRPPASPKKWLVDLQKNVDDIHERYPTSLPPHCETDNA